MVKVEKMAKDTKSDQKDDKNAPKVVKGLKKLPKQSKILMSSRPTTLLPTRGGHEYQIHCLKIFLTSLSTPNANLVYLCPKGNPRLVLHYLMVSIIQNPQNFSYFHLLQGLQILANTTKY